MTNPNRHPVDDLATQVQLAEILGVKPTTLNNWAGRENNGFPEPKEVLGRFKFYSIEEVTHWYELWKKATKNLGRGEELNNAKR